MNNMQSKILSAFEEVATNANLDPVIKAEWANTGRLYFMDGFDTKVEIWYQFNDGYCILAFSGPDVIAIAAPYERYTNDPSKYLLKPDTRDTKVTAHFLKYNDGESIKRVLAFLAEASAKVTA